MKKVRVFLEMIKFEHSLFALPFAYLGLFLAERGWPRPFLFIWVTVAMVSFRTFAMAANRLIDHSIDARNPRTSSRALPQKKLSRRFVFSSALFSLLIFESSCWILRPLCLLLSPVPLALAVLYPYLKRFTWFSHGVLGIILGIAPYGAWLASGEGFSWIPGLLTLGVTAWVSGFDILYSLQDVDFDRQNGFYSVPACFGVKRGLISAGVLHGSAVIAWGVVGFLTHLGWVYGLGILLVAILLWREHGLIRRFGLEKIEEAFFKMNVGVSLAVFLATFLDLKFLG